MSWECINPAEIVANLPPDNPVTARRVASEAVMGKMGCVWRDGLNWGDERLWYGDGDRPFNLSPLLPTDFDTEGKTPSDLFAGAEVAFHAGDWHRGWQLAEFRHQIDQGREQMKRLFMPHWDGKVKPRRLLVHQGQGAGDCIMFSRYLMELDRRGIESDFVVEPSVFLLMKSLNFRSQYRSTQSIRYSGKVLTNYTEFLYDYHCPVESLPLAMGMDSPMECEPYLRPCEISGMDRRVGIVWAGQSFHPRNINRSLTLEQLLEHVPADWWNRLVSLQMGEPREQLNFSPDIEDWSDALFDWMDTACAISQLNGIVCCDTGIAHLAGAMGKRVKLILKQPSEWRWPLEGRVTPWYKSVEIVR